jgi:hypothetical protein
VEREWGSQDSVGGLWESGHAEAQSLLLEFPLFLDPLEPNLDLGLVACGVCELQNFAPCLNPYLLNQIIWKETVLRGWG